MKKFFGNVAKNVKKKATDPKIKQEIAGLAASAASQVSGEKARKISEAAIGKERTEKLTKTGKEYYGKADKALGEGRIDATVSGVKSGFQAASFGGSKAWVWGAAAGGALGFVTKEDKAGKIVGALFGTGKNDETPKTDQTNEAPKVEETDKPKPQKGPKSGPK